jgi:hypothetical protein
VPFGIRDYVLFQRGAPESGCWADQLGRKRGENIINLEKPGCVDLEVKHLHIRVVINIGI